MGRQRAAGAVPRGDDRRQRGHLDEPRCVARRPRDRVRPARRPLHHADRGRRGDGADRRHRLGHAAALQPRRPLDRLHQRPRRRRQRLGADARRQRRTRRRSPTRTSAWSTARRGRRTASSSSRASTSPRSAGSARRDVAVPPLRRQRPADDREAQRAEGRRRAGLLPRRPVPLLLAGRHARAGRSSTTRTPTAASTRSSASTARTARSRRCIGGPGGAVRPTPSPDGRRSPSCAGCAARPRCC